MCYKNVHRKSVKSEFYCPERKKFNRRIEITNENESILFVNAVIENLRYAIISVDALFNQKDYSGYYDEYTFYFFHMQSILTAQGNIYNVLFNDYFGRKQISEERVKKSQR